MESAVGRVLASFADLKISDDTLVIFTSDNGALISVVDNRPLREGKSFLYEAGIRVPMIIRHPGVVAANVESKTPVVSTDLLLTVLDACGMAALSAIQLGERSGVSRRIWRFRCPSGPRA